MNIFHSHENKTKNPYIYVSYLKREKWKKKTYIPTLLRFPAFKKSQYEQSENDGHVIISEKEKHKININQMCEILTVTKIPFKVLYLFL